MRPPTPSQTVGPFFGFALPLVDGDGEGRVEGQVLDGAGEPVTDALLEIWQGEHFCRCRTDGEGAFHFAMPDAVDFVNVTVFARGLLRHLNTRMYVPHAGGQVPEEVEAGRRSTLVARREDGVLRWDVRLQGPDETVFFL
jgi:protocatechuate 3,4-dioxygenase, alpha subunit